MEQQAYISKTLTKGNITIVVRRPVLDADEQQKRKQQITDTLEHSLRGYLARTGV